MISKKDLPNILKLQKREISVYRAVETVYQKGWKHYMGLTYSDIDLWK